MCISLFIYRYILLKKAVNRTDYMALNGRTGNELEGMWKEGHFIIISDTSYLLEQSEIHHKKHQERKHPG